VSTEANYPVSREQHTTCQSRQYYNSCPALRAAVHLLGTRVILYRLAFYTTLAHTDMTNVATDDSYLTSIKPTLQRLAYIFTNEPIYCWTTSATIIATTRRRLDIANRGSTNRSTNRLTCLDGVESKTDSGNYHVDLTSTPPGFQQFIGLFLTDPVELII